MVWESQISLAVQQGCPWMKKVGSEEGLRCLHRSKGQVSALICNLYIGTLCKLLFAERISVAYLRKVWEIHWTRWSLWTLLLLSCFSCAWLCDSMDCSLPGSSVHEILQRILEWIVLPSSRGSSWLRDGICIGRRILYNWRHLGSPSTSPTYFKSSSYSSNKQLVGAPTVPGTVHCFYDSSSRSRREGKLGSFFPFSD